jgi:hypothetical protein
LSRRIRPWPSFKRATTLKPYAGSMSDNSSTSLTSGAGYAFAGVVLVTIAGIFVAQAGGGDRETFLSIGFMVGSVGLLCIIIGGAAIAIGLARD